MTDPTPATEPSTRPWHREPLVWLVIAIPALTVVAGLSTVVIAHHGADDPVADDVRKEGLAIHQDPARDRAATALGVSATLAIGDGRVRVVLAPGSAPRPSSLIVVLSHATRAQFDQLASLSADADGSYTATLPPLRDGHWFLELTPADRAWRLTSDFTGRGATLALTPEVANPSAAKL
jgi:hypothetical protein